MRTTRPSFPGNSGLDELGGIGAILRYALDEGRPTADL